MYIRTKVQLVILLIVALAVTVSVLVPIDRMHLTETTDRLVDRGVAALDLDARIRVEVLTARRAEDRILASDDPTFATDVLAHVARLNQLAATGGGLTDEQRVGEQYDELTADGRRYGDAVSALARVLAQGKESLDRWRARLVGESDAALGYLERLDMEMSSRTQPPGRLARQQSVQEFLVRASTRIRELRRLGEVLAGRHMGEALPKTALARHREVVQEALSDLGEVTEGVGARAALASARYEFDSMSESLAELDGRVASLRGALADHKRDTTAAAERLWNTSERLHRANRSAIGVLRRDAALVAEAGVFRILLVLALGGGLVTLAGLLVVRDLTRRLRKLTQGAQRILQGDVDARVVIEGDDEIDELAASFNRMAERVQSQHDRQRDLNRIVTLLNVAAGTHALFDRSIGELARVAGADLGLVYLMADDGRSLRLVATHALSGRVDATQRVRLGEGVLGTAAEERRVVRVTDLQDDALRITTGGSATRPAEVLILPILLGDILQGVVELGRAGRFDTEIIPFVEELLSQIAVAAGTARTWETLQRTAEELAAKHSELEEKTRELEEQGRSLRAVNEELAEVSRLKTEFLANVSHELRTPLNSIMGFTEIVRDKTPDLAPRRRRNLDNVLRNARHLMALIDDLLDLSRIESGRVTIKPERFEIGELVEESLRVVQPLTAGKEVALESELDADLPELHTDRRKVRQILLNLLSNAVKFTDGGAVRIVARTEAGEAFIDVVDTGIGIAPDELPRVFDKFHQVDGSSSRRHGGTGLGLAISRDLATHLGGKLTARSTLGKGSCFQLRLPAVYRGKTLNEHVVDPPGPEGVEEPSPTERIRRRQVVVVDEDPRTVIVCRQSLQGSGIEVRSAFTMEEGLAILRRTQAHAVVFDPWRPSKQGRYAIDTLRGEDGVGGTVAIGLALTSDGELGLLQTVEDGQLADGPAPQVASALAAAVDDAAVEALLVGNGQPRDELFARLASLLEGRVKEPPEQPGATVQGESG